jgi:hypothetical protein
MEDWITLFISVMGGIFIVTLIGFFTWYILKESKKKARMTTFFGFKSAKIKFKVLDLSMMHSLTVFPNRQYEVVYRLETEEGTISVSVDDQVEVETSSRIEGSEIITIKRFQPIVYFLGKKAKNGEASVRIYRRR